MSHEVESMFYVNEVPWHGLGTRVEEAPSAEEAMKLAGLDWEVETRPVYCDGEMDRFGRTMRMVVPDAQAVVRTSDSRVLAAVGSRYRPVQNAAAFSFCDAIGSGPEGTGDVRYETAGSLKEGRVIWMLARMERDRFEVVPGDEVVPYLLLSNRHDGRGSLYAKLVNTRVVCANTLSVASKEDGAQFRVRHTGDVKGKVDAARETLGLARKLLEAEKADIARLCAAAFTRSKLSAWTDLLLPITEEAAKSERAVFNVLERRAEIARLFDAAPGNTLPGVAGTAWAAVNAATYVGTHAQGRGWTADKGFESALFGAGEDLGLRAKELALAAL